MLHRVHPRNLEQEWTHASRERARAATDRIADATEQVRQTAGDHPLTTLMFVGAAAFAVGALRKTGRRPSRYLPKDYARYIPKEYLPRAWR